MLLFRSGIKFRNVFQRSVTTLKKQRTGSSPIGKFLVVVPFLCLGLGTWQVKRLKWKRGLIRSMNESLDNDAVPLPSHITQQALKGLEWKRVWIEGQLQHHQEMLVGPRTVDGFTGYHVVTPLIMGDGRRILVKRGWIPRELKDQKSRDPASMPQGKVRVEGLLRTHSDRPWYMQKDRLSKDEFFFVDVNEMSTLTGSEPLLLVQLAEPNETTAAAQNAAKDGFPIAEPREVKIFNSHMEYIITWYSLAAVSAVMLYYFRKNGRKTFQQDALNERIEAMKRL
ncbi:SURF-family protein [Schizosaccharomyces japonicus yFS275]|uniref:SURF1-like protein n=1 Tax=Schizosaccharomyces japonicus (strain yFS275 / FY16936) TaxID=402676 RepID=B6K364_SCHJY|nr:SURF-family protein [Schizosaccharomyces japonicus yFS275]EEB07921.1 SURF-family protein [Schizosaccharomyces japonicus yFS275]